jgi:hypothetical protein
MGKFHIDRLASLVIVKIIEGGVFHGHGHIIDDNGKSFFVKQRGVVVRFHKGSSKRPFLLVNHRTTINTTKILLKRKKMYSYCFVNALYSYSGIMPMKIEGRTCV